MKNKLTITIVLGIGLWWAVGVFSTCSANSNLFWGNKLDTLSRAEFYVDLDARDEFNRPLKSISAKENLKYLFLSGLSEQLTRQELGTIKEAYAVIHRTVETGICLVRFFSFAIGKIIAVAATGLGTQIKTFVQVLRWLPPLLNFGVLSLTFLLKVAPVKKPPLVLRC